MSHPLAERPPPSRVPRWLIVTVCITAAACWITPIVFIARAIINR